MTLVGCRTESVVQIRRTPTARNARPASSENMSALVGITLATGGVVIGIGATGFVAYLLLWGSVIWGLLLSTGTGRAWMRPPQLLDAHQFLSAAGAGFACFHGLVLMGDRYVSFPLRAVVLPFGGSYDSLLVACGQLAAWLSLLLIASFHVGRHTSRPSVAVNSADRPRSNTKAVPAAVPSTSTALAATSAVIASGACTVTA